MAAYRSPVALTDAITAETRYRLRLATILGAGAAIIVSFLAGVFSPVSPAAPAGSFSIGVAFAAVSVVAFILPYLTERERYRAIEVAYWAALGSARRAAELTGERRIPSTPAQAVAWLARHPDADAARHLRVYCQLVVGDIPAARELASRMPDATPTERVTLASSQELIRLVEGTPPDTARLRTLGSDLASVEDRLAVEVDASILEALTAAADGADWTIPLTRLRARVGSSADGTLLRHYWVPIIIALVVGGAVLAIGVHAIRVVLLG